MDYFWFYLLLIAMPIAYGYAEAEARLAGPLSGAKLLFGHFGMYHVTMFLFFLGFNFLMAEFFNINPIHSLTFIPITVLIEDYAYFLFHPKDNLDPNDWVNWHFGGMYISKKSWLPGVYIMLFLAGGLLITLGHII